MAIEDFQPTDTDLFVPVGEGREASLSLPPTASTEECAAVAAAISAHLTDRQRTADDDAGPQTVDRWKLAGRLGIRDHGQLPRQVRRGEEWKAAARTWK